MKISTYPISQFMGDRINQISGEQVRRLQISEITNAKNEICKQREERL